MKNKTKKEAKIISAEEFDKKFDDGEDVSEYVDWDAATKTVNVDFPIWMIRELDKEATRIGIARQALIKTWIDDHLKHIERAKAVAKNSPLLQAAMEKLAELEQKLA